MKYLTTFEGDPINGYTSASIGIEPPKIEFLLGSHYCKKMLNNYSKKMFGFGLHDKLCVEVSFLATSFVVERK